MAQKLDKAKNVVGDEQTVLCRRDDHTGRNQSRRSKCGGGWKRRHGHCRGPLAQGCRLTNVVPGAIVRVDYLHGDEDFRGKMMAMGIVPGASLSVLQGGAGRPLLVRLAGGRFFLDPRVCELVGIRPDGDEEVSNL
ncbi:MAG: ferrous iron transport protein A [Armatimonadetes bacterium]|nr:ferrous iron transport protein A [Armatimonadota bacterium]